MSTGKFGERVKQRRLELGFSQDELAKKLGYSSRSTINKIENGTNDVSTKKVLEFAQALETTVPYLLNGDDDESPNRTFLEVTDTEIDILKAFRKSDTLTQQMILRLLNVKGGI